ncbi:Oxidoreductase, Glucose/ribitol dehydrogenase family [Nitrospira sp. KM1]|uniref:SDR family oxidoreductase n=1 Tax=Nitrospira sp. KM1 TaxID=1936990 RepID=UPI0013A7B347|nr:SDR family oxidoreductase [Nitrospira sp. KM1]BCA53135.1 Oxidoreductase, Glucose/ribitol dehydrogenase family [Nitrospira sp. KM1]
MQLDLYDRFVMITGASTGIGAACALACAQRGMNVFAGVRTREAGELLQQQPDGKRVTPVYLDVTDTQSIACAADIVRNAAGLAGLAGLINNAGIAIGSPLEVIPLAALRRQMEVNVIGQIAVTQAFLPLIRQASGRIVNMGSIAGRGTIPMMGPYSASKHALEALTDALRLELRQWGIHVSIIEPGAVATPIWEKSLKTSSAVEEEVTAEAKALYGEAARRIRESVDQASRRAISTDAVAEAVWHALTAKQPKTRYLVGVDARIRALMVKWLPDRLQDWILTKVLHLPQ